MLIVAVAMWGYSCGDSTTDGGDEAVEAIVGDWVSQGSENVAPGLQALVKTARINATFEANGTYDVVSIDSAGAEVTFRGTYEVGPETASGIRTITLNQSTPASVTSQGIYQIAGTTLTYEVIQTEPEIGATAPTVTGGFGSTTVQGVATGIFWVQKFEKQ